MMSTAARRGGKVVVLLGAGHTHLHVLRHWRAQASPGATLICISNFHAATYSAMLPGVLAADYSPAAMEIALAPLCEAAGATLVVDDPAAVDVSNRHVVLSDRRTVAFDLLSIGVGSVARSDGVSMLDTSHLVHVKPMQTFLHRLRDACHRAREARRTLVRIVIAGGGAGGVEVALCLPRFVASVWEDDVVIDRTLVSGSSLMDGGRPGVARRARNALARAGVRVIEGRRVTAVERGTIRIEGQGALPADIVVWVTGAAPPPILDTVSLPKDAAGFLQVDDTLRSPADSAVFVVGDAGSLTSRRIAKAGVYAVREGPILLENLRRALGGVPLEPFRPQRRFLELLNTGDGRAIGGWRGFSFEGRWCRRLKDSIDRRFVARYQSLR